MTGRQNSLKMDFNTRAAAPGHPVKFLQHRSSFDLGQFYRNVGDWQIEKSKTLYRKNLVAHFGCVNAIEFSKDGSMLVSGGDDRRVLLWNVDKAILAKDEPRVMRAEHLSNVFSCDFSCTQEKIISAGNDDQVIVHDIATGTPLDYFVHEQPVYSVSADPMNESVFCSACDDGQILIFDIRAVGSEPFCLAKSNSAYHSVMYHPVEPRLVVTANSKEGVASWDVRMPKRTFVKYGLQNSNQCCMSARFNRLGSQILVLRRRLPPILYSTDSPSHLFQFNHRGYYNSCTMKSCSFAGQDDQFVLSGSDNFDLHLWKIPTPGSDQWVNKADMILRGHRSIVNQVRYNYVHNVIASSGVEKIVKLWSPFPLPEPGGKVPTVVTNEMERRIYTPDDYVSLVMQSGHGQGNFMSLTYEAGRKTTREDSRMLAFFDALVQRDINGLSDDESDNFPETSYTNTVYSTPETSSSENEDEDSNPPNYRSLLAAASSVASSLQTSQELGIENDPSIEHSTSDARSVGSSPDAIQENESSEDNVRPVTPGRDYPMSNPPDHVASDDAPLDVGEEDSLEETEDRDVTANRITQLILEKEDTRRKLMLRSAKPKTSSLNTNDPSANNGQATASDSETEDSSSEETNEGDETRESGSRPLCLSRRSRRAKSNDNSKSVYDCDYNKSQGSNKLRKIIWEQRRRMLSSTPVYDSSRNSTDIATTSFAQPSFERISELMTRNQLADQSDSSVDSSSSSSSDSSSSEVEEGERGSNNSQSVILGSKKASSMTLNLKKPRSRAIISTDDSTSSGDERKNDDVKKCAIVKDGISCSSIISEPSTSSAAVAQTNRDLKRKRRPHCKLNEACKAFFKRYIDSEISAQREQANEEEEVTPGPTKRILLDNPSSAETNNSVEQVVFIKRLAKHKDRNYRKSSISAEGTSGSGTPPDSGIDVSKEPEPCCSKSCVEVSSSSMKKTRENSSTVDNPSNASPNDPKDKRDELESLEDPGFGQVESDDGSD